MPLFVPKAWQNAPSTLTPVSGPALTDVEQRLADFSLSLSMPEIVDAGTTTGTVTLDMTGRQNVLWLVRLGGNHTLNITNWTGAQSVALILRQDAVGGRVPVLPAAKWGGGTQPTVTATAEALDVLTFVSDRYTPSPYSTVALSDGPAIYWRLGEPSGTTANDAVGAQDGTYVNSPTLGVLGGLTGDSDTGVTFDGVDERVLTTTLGSFGSTATASTYEFWMKTNTSGQGHIFGTVSQVGTLIMACRLNTDENEVLAANKTLFQFRSNDGSGTLRGSINVTGVYNNTWHHVVCRIDTATTMTVMVDGTTRAVTYANLGAGFISPGNLEFPMTLAARNLRGTADNHYAGSLDEVAFYSKRLSLDRMLRHYAAGRQTPFGNTYGGVFDLDFQ